MSELTDREVSSILEQAEKLDRDCYYLFSRNKTDINRISKAGLIFINGDKRIGIVHISERHNGIKKHYRSKSLPTIFDLALAPVNYHILADEIYLQGNSTLSDYNTVYDAYLPKSESVFSRYRLVLFRDTQIVVTMYPIGEMKPKPKYVRSFWGKAEQHPLLCTTIINYRFLNEKEVPIFYLKVELNGHLNTETREIQIMKKGVPNKKVYERVYPLRYNLDHIMLFIDTLTFPEEEEFVNEYNFN